MKVIPENYLDGTLKGHTDNYLLVSFKGCEALIGKSVNVKITDYKDKVLIGKIKE